MYESESLNYGFHMDLLPRSTYRTTPSRPRDGDESSWPRD